jgi:hypothetical protein
MELHDKNDLKKSELGHRLYKFVGLPTIWKNRNGIQHIIINNFLHLGFKESYFDNDVETCYVGILEEISRNVQRFSPGAGGNEANGLLLSLSWRY